MARGGGRGRGGAGEGGGGRGARRCKWSVEWKEGCEEEGVKEEEEE